MKKVSVCVLTFNHRDYIEECINSILKQKVNFDLEILIFDDCSTDGTTEILSHYQKEYSDIIKHIVPAENQYAKGVRGLFAKFLYPNATGRYIALCEGDDYWIDDSKLQKQADFLDNFLEYSLVFTNRVIVDKKSKIMREEKNPEKDYNIEDIFNGFVPSTQTIMMRNEPFITKVFHHYKNIYSGDRVTAYICALVGKIKRLEDVTSAYRETGDGIWSSFNEQQAILQRTSLLKTFHKQLGYDHDNPLFVKYGYNRWFAYLKEAIRSFNSSNFRFLFSYWRFLNRNFKYYNRTKIFLQVIKSKLF